MLVLLLQTQCVLPATRTRECVEKVVDVWTPNELHYTIDLNEEEGHDVIESISRTPDTWSFHW